MLACYTSLSDLRAGNAVVLQSDNISLCIVRLESYHNPDDEECANYTPWGDIKFYTEY